MALVQYGNNLVPLDERAMFEIRYSIFEKWLDGNLGTIGVNDDDKNQWNADEVNISNLPSLKKGNMASKDPLSKLALILTDKQRLSSWIQNYKIQFEKTFEKDSIKIATFREAGTRLKMLLDDGDFDEGDLRVQRRKAIEEINDHISGL